MILFNMDYPSIFRQMFSESEKTEYYLQKKIDKVISGKEGFCVEPSSFYDIVTMPKTNNKYLLYWRVGNMNALLTSSNKNMEKYLVSGSMLLLNDQKGQQYGITYKRYKSYDQEEVQLVDGINVFTPHFFSRYRERFVPDKNIKAIENIALFAARNLNYFVHLDYNGMVLPQDRKENGAAVSIRDGVILGAFEMMTVDGKPVEIMKARTFLNKQSLKEVQSSLNPTKQDVYRNAREMFKKYNGYDPKELI